MIVRKPSASKLDRALACAPSCWLPAAESGGESTEAAERGTRIHRALERSYMGARLADCLAAVKPSEYTLAASAIDNKPSVLPFGDWPLVEAEVWYQPLARDVQFGITPACHHTNPLPPPPGYYRGTADLIGEDPLTGRLCVVDHKTGNPRFQTHPAVSAQLRHAAMLFSTHPLTAGRVAVEGVELIVYLTQKAGTAGALLRHHATPDQLEKFADEYMELAILLEAVESGLIPDVEATPNKHCKFCVAAPGCEAYQTQLEGAP